MRPIQTQVVRLLLSTPQVPLSRRPPPSPFPLPFPDRSKALLRKGLGCLGRGDAGNYVIYCRVYLYCDEILYSIYIYYITRGRNIIILIFFHSLSCLCNQKRDEGERASIRGGGSKLFFSACSESIPQIFPFSDSHSSGLILIWG